jgi:Threonine synthase
MKYISTRSKEKEYSFGEVFLKGLADDGGLYVPKSIKKYNSAELSKLKNLNYSELSAEIISQFSGDFISREELSSLIKKSYSKFREKEVVKFSNVEKIKLLELFHGPTLAFKDVAMQFIGNLYEYYLSKNDKKINIVVATSGDTGAAAIDAIKGKSNLNIFVLHPNNKISSVQRKIMTPVENNNVFNIAIDGNFDDCQNNVKTNVFLILKFF